MDDAKLTSEPLMDASSTPLTFEPCITGKRGMGNHAVEPTAAATSLSS